MFQWLMEYKSLQTESLVILRETCHSMTQYPQRVVYFNFSNKLVFQDKALLYQNTFNCGHTECTLLWFKSTPALLAPFYLLNNNSMNINLRRICVLILIQQLL